MAGNFGLDFGWKGGGAGFGVAQVAIKSEQRRPGADHAKVDGDAALSDKVVCGGVHQFAPQAGALPRGIDAQQTQIAAIAAKFYVNATSETCRIFRQKEFPFFHVGADAFGIRAIAVYEGLLDAKSEVDQTGEGFDIGFLSEANVYFLQVRTRIRCRWHGFISAELSSAVQACNSLFSVASRKIERPVIVRCFVPRRNDACCCG